MRAHQSLNESVTVGTAVARPWSNTTLKLRDAPAIVSIQNQICREDPWVDTEFGRPTMISASSVVIPICNYGTSF